MAKAAADGGSRARRSRRGPRLGAHVSTAGHIDIAIDHATAIGAEAMQIFGAAPQQWRRKLHPDEDVAAFREKVLGAGLGPNFMHGIYLINLASQDKALVKKGVEALTADLRLAAALGVSGVIFHVGSHRGAGFGKMLPQMVRSMKAALADSPPDAWLCIENNAGAGDSVCSSFEEIAAIMDGIGSERVKVCLDTCHLFAADYDIATPSGLRKTVANFNKEIGAAQLVAVHANDSKTSRGSGRDRHENIGQGTLGFAAFEGLIKSRLFKRATWLLEVPGYEGGGPDALNLNTLRAMRDGGRRPQLPKAKR